jgi:hypothetical protein
MPGFFGIALTVPPSIVGILEQEASAEAVPTKQPQPAYLTTPHLENPMRKARLFQLIRKSRIDHLAAMRVRLGKAP